MFELLDTILDTILLGFSLCIVVVVTSFNGNKTLEDLPWRLSSEPMLNKEMRKQAMRIILKESLPFLIVTVLCCIDMYCVVVVETLEPFCWKT